MIGHSYLYLAISASVSDYLTFKDAKPGKSRDALVEVSYSLSEYDPGAPHPCPEARTKPATTKSALPGTYPWPTSDQRQMRCS